MYPTTYYNDFYTTPKFNISTEPHYKIRKYLEENIINFPNKKILDKIISKAWNKKKYEGTMDLTVPGNKNVLTDSDSEGQNYNMKKINKNMQKKNGCADLIITKIESQAPQRNEEYYKFTNQKRYYGNNDPFYGARTLTNFNHKIIYEKKTKPVSPLYIPNEQNNYYKNKNNFNNNYNVYTTNRILTTSDTSRVNKLGEENNFHFNSTVDLKQINVKKNKNKKQINEINKSPNQQISYESSAEAEQGSSSYVYHPAKVNIPNKNNNIKKNLYKENEYSAQSISNNEEPYIKKKLEIKPEIIKTKPKISIYKIPSKKPTIKELLSFNYNNKGFSILQNKFNQRLIKNVIKIQSAWRGYITRYIIKKNLNLIRFTAVLVENIKNKYLDYISDFFYDLKKMKMNSERNENYDGLLKDYNLLLDEYNKIEKEMNQIKKIQKKNHFDNLTIVKKENNFEILDINLDLKTDNSEKRNFNNIKIFEIIQPEQKEEFSIMKLNEKKSKLRNINKKYNHKIDNKIEDNINHFTSNINIIKNNNFTLKENKASLPSKANNTITKLECLTLLSAPKDNKDLDKINSKTPILINENQQNMNIYIIGKNEKPRKFNDILVKENKNDINIIPIVNKVKLYKKKLFCKYHHKFDEENLIIVKKSNMNILCKKTPKNLVVDKNTLHIKKSKKSEKKIVKDKNDFNIINEIDKRDGLEINTLEMKRTKKKETNPEIIVTEKAKRNMMKIILPIKLKTILKEFVRRIVFNILKNLEDK